MIYLNKKQFLPAMILISIMFVPIMLMLTCLCLFYNVFQPFLIIGILLVTYLLLIFCFFKISKSTKNYLIINNDGLDICCGNKYCDKNTGVWKVPYNEIARIDYYRISSLKGWVSLWTGLLPKCVFITIQNRGGKENSVFIGYLDLDQVKLIANTGNIEIFVH